MNVTDGIDAVSVCFRGTSWISVARDPKIVEPVSTDGVDSFFDLVLDTS